MSFEFALRSSRRQAAAALDNGKKLNSLSTYIRTGLSLRRSCGTFFNETICGSSSGREREREREAREE